MTTPRKRRIDGAVQDWITDWCLTKDWTPAQIHREITARYEREKKAGKTPEWSIPHLRTVERIVKETSTEDETGPWSLANSDGQDARLILEVFKWLCYGAYPRARAFSKLEAEWVLRIRKVAPDLNPMIVWVLAQLYKPRVKDKENTQDLDSFLACTPWKDKFCYNMYKIAITEGRIPPAPMWGQLVEGQNPELAVEAEGNSKESK